MNYANYTGNHPPLIFVLATNSAVQMINYLYFDISHQMWWLLY